MKKLFWIFLLVVISKASIAQALYEVAHVENAHQFGFEKAVYTLSLNHTDIELFEKEAQNYFQKQTKASAEKTNELFGIKNVIYKSLSNDTFSFYWRIVPQENAPTMYISFEHGTNVVSPLNTPIIHEKVKTELKKVSKHVLSLSLNATLKNQNSRVKDLEKDRKSANKNADKIRKKISKVRVEIDKREKEISLNDGQQKHKAEQIGQKMQQAEGLDGEMKKAAKSELKTLEKESKSLYKDKEGIHKSVLKLEAEKRELEYELNIEQAKVKSIEEQIGIERVEINKTANRIKEVKRIK